MARPDVPEEVRVALKTILEYNWRDECKNAAGAAEEDGGCPPDHVFTSMVCVYNWLYGENRTPESCFDDPAYPDHAWPDPGGYSIEEPPS
jgi:hypothetical protein